MAEVYTRPLHIPFLPQDTAALSNQPNAVKTPNFTQTTPKALAANACQKVSA